MSEVVEIQDLEFDVLHGKAWSAAAELCGRDIKRAIGQIASAPRSAEGWANLISIVRSLLPLLPIPAVASTIAVMLLDLLAKYLAGVDVQPAFAAIQACC